jgi:hypothetical protein
MNQTTLASALLAGLLALAGCEKSPSPPARPAAAGSAAALPPNLFLTSAPADAKPLEEAKQAAKPGDPITLRGRIGGSESPFVDGRAVFTIVGPGLKACADNPEDTCKTPWDYCCENAKDIAAHSATVQIVDAAGQPLKLSLKGQHDLKELAECTIVGKVAQADGPVLVVNAAGIYVTTK